MAFEMFGFSGGANVQQGAIQASNSIAPVLTFILVLLLMVAVIAFAVWFIIWNFFIYNIKVTILEERNNSIKVRMKRAKKVTIKGVTFYRIMGDKNKWKPPQEFSSLFSSTRGKDVLFLYKTSESNYAPIVFDKKGKIKILVDIIKPDGTKELLEDGITVKQVEKEIETLKMEVIPQDILFWWMTAQERNTANYTPKPSFFQQYGGQLVIFGSIAIIVVLMIIMFSKFEVIASALTSAAQTCERVQNVPITTGA